MVRGKVRKVMYLLVKREGKNRQRMGKVGRIEGGVLGKKDTRGRVEQNQERERDERVKGREKRGI